MCQTQEIVWISPFCLWRLFIFTNVSAVAAVIDIVWHMVLSVVAVSDSAIVCEVCCRSRQRRGASSVKSRRERSSWLCTNNSRYVSANKNHRKIGRKSSTLRFNCYRFCNRHASSSASRAGRRLKQTFPATLKHTRIHIYTEKNIVRNVDT